MERRAHIFRVSFNERASSSDSPRMYIFTSCASTVRPRTWLPSDGRVLTDQECQDGTRNISRYGVCLRVPLHDEGK